MQSILLRLIRVLSILCAVTFKTILANMPQKDIAEAFIRMQKHKMIN